MKNVEALLRDWVNADRLELLADFLRPRDPEFAALEEACHADGGALDALRRKQINAGLMFAFWQGMRLNLENFYAPIGTAALTMDLSQLVREHILFNMPAYKAAQQELSLLKHDLSEEAMAAVEEYYAYLETVGLKVAHYLGFRQGDFLYPMTEPGYVPDGAATQTYRMALEQYLGISLS